jgi:hypothetical protein
MNAVFVTLVVYTVLTLLGSERVGTDEDGFIVLLQGVITFVAKFGIFKNIPGFGLEGTDDIGGTAVTNNRAGGSNFWINPINGVEKNRGLPSDLAMVR